MKNNVMNVLFNLTLKKASKISKLVEVKCLFN